MHRPALLLTLLAAGPAQADGPLKLNPFNDPFVAVRVERPCPEPRGPAYDEAGMREEAHGRAERGTSCWLAGTCSEPNAYRYDKRIAERVVKALREEPSLAGSAIWLIAERRFVILQGCVESVEQAARAEAIAKQDPEVHIVIPWLVLPGETPRYPLAASAAGR